jgi:HEAT repeat protein
MSRADVKAAIAGDSKALNRIARAPGAYALIAEVGAKTRSDAVAARAGTLLSRRNADASVIPAIARLLRSTPARDVRSMGFEWAAMALAARKEPAALRAALASYRVMPTGRARYFLLLTLSNRTEREKPLRANAPFMSLMLDAVRDRTDSEERNAAAWALLQLAHPRATATMIELLTDSDDYIQMTAARTLVRIGRADGLVQVRAFIARCKDAELVTELTAALAKAARSRSR